MASLSRSEYRHEEQRRVTESPFRETKWDRHLDTLLTDLNESVGGTGRSSAGGGSQSRSLVPSTGAGGVVTEVHGAPGSGDFHERREYTTPDQRTRVIEERFEKTARGDAGVPGRLFISNRYETNNGMTTNRWPNADDRRDTTGAPRPAHDLRSPDAVRSEPGYGRTEPGYGRAEPYGRTEPYGRPEPGFGRSAPRSPDPVRSEPDYARGYDFPRRGRDLPDDLRSEPEYGGGGEPEPWLWRGGRTGSVRSVTGATGRQTTGEPFGRRYGSARAPGHGRRSPTYAEVYRSSAETYRRTEEPYRSSEPYRSAEPYRSTREPYQSSGEPYRSSGEPYRSSGEPYRSSGEPYRSTGEPYRSSTEPYGYSRPYQPPSGFASALSPVQPTSNNRPSTNDGFRLDSNQSVTKQVYKTSSYSSEGAAPQNQPSIQQQQQGDPSRFKQNILELDSLLDDLDHARKKPGTNGVDNGTTFDGPAGTSTPYRQTNVQKTTKTSKYVTSSGGDRQPTAGDQLTTLGLTGPRHSPSPNPLEGIDRGLVPELAEPPAAGTTRVTRYEYRSSNRRDVSPQPAVVPAPVPAPVRPVTVDRREYTSATSTLDRPQPPVTDTTDKTTTYVYNSERSGTLPPGVPGVPGVPVQPGSNTTINYHIYNYGTLGPDGQPVLPPGVPAPPPGSGTLPRRDVITSSTTSSTSAHQYRETSPPPQRSPAPGPDTTVSNSYVFEKHSHNSAPQRHPSGPGAPGGPGGPSGPGGPGPNVLHSTSTSTKHYTIGPDGREIPARPASPYDQQYPKFPVDDGPSGPQGHHTRTTTTTIERTQTRGSPFPARSPSPSPRRQQPRDDGPRVPFPGSPRRPVDDIDTPRRVDELMAQIPDTPQDGTYPRGPVRRELNNGRTTSTSTTHFTVHEREPLLDTQTQVTLDAKSGAVVPQTASKPVSGPPIYYPPGSTEFKPKPESEMMFQSYESRGGGKYASGYKAKGKYKAKAGSKESHAEGGAVIPICLPLCCGAACSVM